MKLFCSILALIYLLVSCATLTEKQLDTDLIANYPPAINVIDFDTTVRPQDDIFQFVNGNWLARNKNKLVETKSAVNTIDKLTYQTEQQLNSLLQGLLQNNYPIDSNEFKLKTLYQSYLNTDSRESLGLTPLNVLVNEINQIQNIEQLEIFLINATKAGRPNPFITLNVNPYFRDSSVYRVYLSIPKIQISSATYNIPSVKNQRILDRYQLFIRDVLLNLKITDAAIQAQQIIELERSLSKPLIKQLQSFSNTIDYQEYNATQLLQLSPHFDLLNFLTKIGIEQEKYITKESAYYAQLGQILSQQNLATIKNYLKFVYFVYYSSYLDRQSHDLVFDFYGRYLRGNKEITPLQSRAIGFINYYLGEMLGKLYVEQFFSVRKKQQVLVLAGMIKQSFRQRLMTNQWLSANSKKTAIAKLDNLKIKVAFPDSWQDFSSLTLADNTLNLVQLVEQLDHWEFANKKNQIGEKVDKNSWSVYPQTINAYYDVLNNEVVYPAAILQPPFYYENADMAVLLGTFGSLMGHEMGHAFDTMGLHYDLNGAYQDELIIENKQQFNEKTAKLVHQYSQYFVIDGVKVNGGKTLNENIADLSGLNIAFSALQDYLKDKKETLIDGYTDKQRFFLAWVGLFKNTVNDEVLAKNNERNIHAPAKIRSYVPLTNMDAFYQAFDIKPGDGLYHEPQQRIIIW